MRIIALFCFALTSVISWSQDSVSVLFIGNSYTYGNDLPTLFQNLTSSLGDIATVDSRTQGGAQFNTHAANASTYTKIHANPWDFVVLQDQSQAPSFPDEQVNSSTLPYAQQLADSIYANNFCSQVMYFMTWGRENGDPQWEPISTYDGMQTRLRNAYVRFADSTEGSVSPVGMAWKYVRENHPTIDLYTADESHPNINGSYLAACTFYASIFRKTPVGAPFISSLDATTAGHLQEAAAIAVLHADSLETFFLRENPTLANFSMINNGNFVAITNQSWRATDYSFDFDDGTVLTDENPTYEYSTTGNFTITLTASSQCNSDEYSLAATSTIGVNEENNPTFTLKTLENNAFVLISENEIGEYSIINSSGKRIKKGNEKSKQLNLNLNKFTHGVYIVRTTSTTLKIVVK